MGRSLQAASFSAMSDAFELGDAFCFLAFNHGTGEILAHGRRAVFALARADLREPDGTIEILNAGVAGENLWLNQTPLQLARQVVDMLAAAGDWEQASPPKLRVS